MFGNLFDFNRDGKTDSLELGFVLAIAEEEERQAAEKAAAEEEEAFDELWDQVMELRGELASLQEELVELEGREPEDICSDAHDRWEERKDLLEEQISDVEGAIEESEDELSDD